MLRKLKLMYLFPPITKTCVFCIIVFTISGISSAQENQKTEIKNNLRRDKKIVKSIRNIPQHSRKLHIGPLRLYPLLEISETFDDNVFDAADTDAITGDFYTTYKPAILLVLPIKKHLLELNYGSEIYEYTRDHSPTKSLPFPVNKEQDHVNQYFGGSVSLNFHNDFSITLSNQTSMNRRPGKFTRRTNPTVQFLDEEDGDEDEVLSQFGFNTFTRRRDFTINIA